MNSGFTERDLGCAAYLRAKGHRLLGLSRIHGDFFSFEFADDTGRCSEDARAYAAGAPCRAQSLIISLHYMKNLLRQEKESKNESADDYQEKPRPFCATG
jgi:hypothetical protein